MSEARTEDSFKLIEGKSPRVFGKKNSVLSQTYLGKDFYDRGFAMTFIEVSGMRTEPLCLCSDTLKLFFTMFVKQKMRGTKESKKT